jgi:hypothetical protein
MPAAVPGTVPSSSPFSSPSSPPPHRHLRRLSERLLLTGLSIPSASPPHLNPHSVTFGGEVGYKWLVSPTEHPIQVSPAALQRVVELRLSGAPLATFCALLASLDQTGHAAITQPALCRLLDSSPGRVWQSLQALVEAGVILPPDRARGTGRRTPYRIPASTAVAPSVPPPPPKRRQRPTW